MDKPLYNVRNFRGTTKCYLGDNNKFTNKTLNYTKRMLDSDESNPPIDPNKPIGTNANYFANDLKTLILLEEGKTSTYQLAVKVLPETASQKITAFKNGEQEYVSISESGLISIDHSLAIAENAQSFTVWVYPYSETDAYSSMRVGITFWLFNDIEAFNYEKESYETRYFDEFGVELPEDLK